jgi:hypothetical protein
MNTADLNEADQTKCQVASRELKNNLNQLDELKSKSIDKNHLVPLQEKIINMHHQYEHKILYTRKKRHWGKSAKNAVAAMRPPQNLDTPNGPKWATENITKADTLPTDGKTLKMHVFQPGSNTPAAIGGPNECTSRRHK